MSLHYNLQLCGSENCTFALFRITAYANFVSQVQSRMMWATVKIYTGWPKKNATTLIRNFNVNFSVTLC